MRNLSKWNPRRNNMRRQLLTQPWQFLKMIRRRRPAKRNLRILILWIHSQIWGSIRNKWRRPSGTCVKRGQRTSVMILLSTGCHGHLQSRTTRPTRRSRRALTFWSRSQIWASRRNKSRRLCRSCAKRGRMKLMQILLLARWNVKRTTPFPGIHLLSFPPKKSTSNANFFVAERETPHKTLAFPPRNCGPMLRTNRNVSVQTSRRSATKQTFRRRLPVPLPK
mmetsp:Transcript_15078/g.27223  ORF Transcript_15078/g.27223 Transcript_15078/m.27223 type:complete len:222 (+) Transcript_15078:745-1410(+)